MSSTNGRQDAGATNYTTTYESLNGRTPGDAADALGMSVYDLRLFLDHGIPVNLIPRDKVIQQTMLGFIRARKTRPPAWMLLSGLCGGQPQNDRRKRLRHLYKQAVGLIRRELLRFENDPDKAERTIYWEPVAEVCAWLEIADSQVVG